jgi:phage-related protein
MKHYFSIIFLLLFSIALKAQTLITPTDVTNFQTAVTNANENDIYQETTNKLFYIGLSSGRLKFLQDSIKTNATLTGSGFNGSVLGLAQQGATLNQVLKWNGTTWLPATETAVTPINSWLFTGNSTGVTYPANFLGTTTDVPLSIRSNNTAMLEVGRRQSIGLLDATSTGLFPYNQPDASVMYVRGATGNSALQFESSGAAFYKPIFFTDADGNFKMRGSSAGTDFFELGSSGTVNNGRLDFTIGDDGDEPIVFNKYNYTPVATVEMMRMQGTGLNNTVRIGVNMAGTVANSTFQVKGSVSANIITTAAAALTLDETNYTVIFTANTNITLPAANTCAGRIYIIKKTFNATSTISNFISNTATATTTIGRGVVQLQSDGTNWQQIN